MMLHRRKTFRARKSIRGTAIAAGRERVKNAQADYCCQVRFL
jgi:hypothetical protein